MIKTGAGVLIIYGSRVGATADVERKTSAWRLRTRDCQLAPSAWLSVQ